MSESEEWFEDYAQEDDEYDIDEYDITATPNDFNVLTLFSFIESGAVKIPGFQRNYVWDRVRASRLIESLIMGIPVPQLFLYEQSRNKFLVIDGQQRLMTIYYFIKRRFPLRERRVDLRSIFDKNGRIPEEILADDSYFEDFKLKLSHRLPNLKNKYNGLNYATLADYRTQFDLRPIRNIVVKQNAPSDDDSSVYEVFNRLNTGGVNLRPQEIRTSMYHSPFYDMLYRINQDSRWRVLLQDPEPDIHMKDIEVLLRGFAMLIEGDNYAPSLVRFLNKFSRKCETHTDLQNSYLEKLFLSFVSACKKLPDDIFINERNKRFNIALFEAVFSAACRNAFSEKRSLTGQLRRDEVQALSVDKKFMDAAFEGTTRTANVSTRLTRARALISAL
ncbi:DUF262 domain-containing protein [Xanthobacter versatilis]|uniref:DUF262 domain-containing protein n=1 Tax=Xanthobacter autotrophicus (strain ATCC BAA-1158 / Py2) TaxID=78245 RepID=UPI003728E3BF